MEAATKGWLMLLSTWLIFVQKSTEGSLYFHKPGLTEGLIYQNAPANTPVMSVKAVEDNSPNAVISYDLLPGTSTKQDGRNFGVFKIDAVTGEITTKRIVTAPLGYTYSLTVTASSRTGGSVSKIIYITVRQYNEFPPVFSKKIYKVLIHRSTEIGTKLLTVQAEDEDVVEANRQIKYKLNEVDDYKYFAVNRQTGAMVLRRQFDPQQMNYLASVIAEDGGTPPGMDGAAVEVTVTDLDAPQNLRVEAAAISAKVCWRSPRSSQPVSYYELSYWVEFNPAMKYNLNYTGPFSRNICVNVMDLQPRESYGISVSGYGADGMPGIAANVKFITFENYCESSPCLHGSCIVTVDGYLCECGIEYRGKLCETRVNICLASPCLHGGTCSNGRGNYKCTCKVGYQGRHCEEKCRTEATGRRYVGGKITFPTQQRGHVLPRCVYDTDTAKNETLPSTATTKDANDIYTWVSTVLRTPNESINTTEITFDELLNTAVNDSKVAKSMFEVISNTLDLNATAFKEKSFDRVGVQLRSFVDKYSSEVVMPKGETNIEVSTRNVHVKVVEVETTLEKHVSPPMMYKPRFDTATTMLEDEISITLPNEAIDRARKQLNVSSASTIRLQFATYQNSKLFHSKRNNFTSNMPVITARIKDVTVQDLLEPVVYVIPIPEWKGEFSCAYWNESGSTWSTYGITTIQKDNTTICHSNHLTGFTILFEVSPHEAISDEHIEALFIISFVGCILSIIGLILTLLTYAIFRHLSRERSTKLLLNLCVSMLLMNIAFLFGSQRDYCKNVCIAIAVFLHYFVLATLTWMCVEAIYMYKMVIRVFRDHEAYFLVKRMIAAWGAPAIIVIVTVSVDVNHYYYEDDSYCRMSPYSSWSYYFAFLMPACLILLINLVIFIRVSFVLFEAPHQGRSDRDSGVTAAQIRGAFTVMTLLGVTWLFGAFAFGPGRLVFAYIFCILNSLQGLLIFFIRCIYHKEARAAWWALLSTCSPKTFGKRRRIDISSSTSGTGSHSQSGGHHGSPKRRHSTLTTVWFGTWKLGKKEKSQEAEPV